MTIYWGVPVSWTTVAARQRQDGSLTTPHIKVTFNLTHRRQENEAEWLEVKSGELAIATLNIYVSDRSLGTAEAPGVGRKQLDALRFNGDFGDGMAFAVDGVELVSHEETWNGKKQLRWELYELASKPQPFSPDLIREMNARYKAARRASSTIQPQPSANQTPNQTHGAGMPAPRSAGIPESNDGTTRRAAGTPF